MKYPIKYNIILHPLESSPRNDVPSRTVHEQRALFEQGNKNKVEEMESHILQVTHAERQRELNMLRSRFNSNKEIARTAARSCVRTSESSEGGGKPSSPKNSPVCPVKPTPAPVRLSYFTYRRVARFFFLFLIDMVW